MVRLIISGDSVTGELGSVEVASPSLNTKRSTAGNVFGSEGFVSMLPHDQNGVFSRAVPQGVPAFPPLLFSPAFSANSPQTVHYPVLHRDVQSNHSGVSRLERIARKRLLSSLLS